LDDTLLRAATFNIAYQNHRIFGNLLQRAGFLLHETKSMSELAQRIKYLGFIIDSNSMTISLPADKVTRLRAAVRKALKEIDTRRVSTIRIAAKTIGFIISSLPATVYSKAHYRQLEFAKLDALQENAFNFDAPFQWPTSTRADLLWWSCPQ
jgi:hypothetical protein